MESCTRLFTKPQANRPISSTHVTSMIVVLFVLGCVILSPISAFQLHSNRLFHRHVALKQQINVISDISFVDFRVGKVLEVSPHPDEEVGEKVYVTKVDVGESSPRTVCAGIAEYIPAESIVNKLVVTCCNLKPRNIEGVMSTGMILVAKDKTLENWALLVPPEGSIIGEQIQIEGVVKEPLEPGNRATKAMSRVNEDFIVNEENVACYQKQKWSTSAGSVTCPVQGAIS